MKNLDQVRAAAALEPAKELDRSAISKLPAMILNNGLLSAAAFCGAEGGGDNRGHLGKAMKAITQHLAKRGIISQSVNDIGVMIKALSESDSITLQRATTEALAYLSYLKRFAEKKN